MDKIIDKKYVDLLNKIKKELNNYENKNVFEGISEFEEVIDEFWYQIIDIYIIENKTFFIGEKGSGKSTIADYYKIKSHKKDIFILRPLLEVNGQSSLWESLAHNIDKLEKNEISLLIDLIIISYISLSLDDKYKDYKSKNKRFIDFLNKYFYFVTNNNSQTGISKFLSVFIQIDELLKSKSLLQIIDEKILSSAWISLWTFIKENNIEVVLFIDDIDEIQQNFILSNKNIKFIESLKAYIANQNKVFIDKKINLKIKLSIPTEINNQLNLTQIDKISKSQLKLNWRNSEQLKKMLSKRISFLLGRTKIVANKREYSESSIHSIYQLFPEKLVINFKEVDFFDYIISYTFYNPRNVLTIFEEIIIELNTFLENYSGIVTSDVYSEKIKNIVFESAEEFSANRVSLFKNLLVNEHYDKVTIKEIINKYFLRNINIWNRRRFDELLMIICAKYPMFDIKKLNDILYYIGVIGTAESNGEIPPYIEKYNLKFSFLGYSENNVHSEYVVISPIFNLYYNDILLKNIISPHKELLLKKQIKDEIDRENEFRLKDYKYSN